MELNEAIYSLNEALQIVFEWKNPLRYDVETYIVEAMGFIKEGEKEGIK